MKFNKKGQGALEYLLLIGGAVLIAVIVIALLVGMSSSSKANTEQTAEKLRQQQDVVVPPHITNIACNKNGQYTVAISEFDKEKYQYTLVADGRIVISVDEFDASIVTGGDGCESGQKAFVTKTEMKPPFGSTASIAIQIS